MKQHLFLIGVQLLIIGVESFQECNTPGCINFANMLIDSMNLSVDPCDDFYEYACGRWAEKNPVPDGEPRWIVLHTLEKLTWERVIDMWKSDSLDTSEAFKKARRMYRSCLNIEAIKRDGTKTILSILNSTGGWPMMMPLKDWNPLSTSLSELLIYHGRSLGLQPLFTIDVDATNATATLPSIERVYNSHLKSFIDGSTDSLEVELYVSNIARIVKILAREAGNRINPEVLETDIKELVSFEFALVKILPAEWWMNKNPTRDVMTIDYFQGWYTQNSWSDKSQIPWIHFLQTIMNGTGIDCTGRDQMVLMNKDDVENLIKLLDNTPFRTIVNHIQWYFIRNTISLWDISDGEGNMRHDSLYNFQRNGLSSRHEECTEYTLSHALLYEFVKRYLPPDVQQMVNATTNGLFNTVNELFDQTLWLTHYERVYLQDKLRKMSVSIGYPPWYDEPFAVDNFYEECDIGDNYLKNVIELERCERMIRMRLKATRSEKEESVQQLIGSGALYEQFSNSLTIEPGLLQPPMIDADYPRVLRYATLGTVIGHEIAHALGLRLVEPYKRVDLEKATDPIDWSDESRAIFESKVDCFVNQYDEYEMYRMKKGAIYVNGWRTREENMADSHGLKVAYKAYDNSKTSEDIDLRLPRLESYSDTQLFFLAYASMMCASEPLKFYKTMVEYPYPTYKLRVIGSLSNMEEFSEAFNCPTTKRMNPERKCGVWGTSN